MNLLRQRIPEPHRDAAFDLESRPLRVHDDAHILRTNDALCLNAPGALIHRDFGDSGHVGPRIDPACDAEASSARRRCRRPTEAACCSLEHPSHTSIRQVIQAKSDRILARGGRHDVDLRFARKAVGVGAWGTPGSRCKWVYPAAASHPRAMVGDVVEVLRAAFTGKQHFVVPERDAAAALHARANPYDRSGPEVVVEELLLPAAHDLHGSAHELC